MRCATSPAANAIEPYRMKLKPNLRFRFKTSSFRDLSLNRRPNQIEKARMEATVGIVAKSHPLGSMKTEKNIATRVTTVNTKVTPTAAAILRLPWLRCFSPELPDFLETSPVMTDAPVTTETVALEIPRVRNRPIESGLPMHSRATSAVPRLVKMRKTCRQPRVAGESGSPSLLFSSFDNVT